MGRVQGSVSPALHRDQREMESYTHIQTTVQNISCATAAKPWNPHLEVALTGVHAAPLQPGQRPIPGLTPSRLPWSELVRASSAAAAPE